MRNVTRQGLTVLAFAASLAAAAAAALAGALAANEGDPASAAQTCRKAEVNPVTGHVLCLDPLGAPVEPPPSASEVHCKPDAHADQAWTWGAKCKSEKPGEG
jgi:hypothetical protein